MKKTEFVAKRLDCSDGAKRSHRFGFRRGQLARTTHRPPRLRKRRLHCVTSPQLKTWRHGIKFMKTQNNKLIPLALALSALGLSLSPIQQIKAAGFVEVSPMNKARNFHTATLLPN